VVTFKPINNKKSKDLRLYRWTPAIDNSFDSLSGLILVSRGCKKYFDQRHDSATPSG
jgi:hypothetical protein